MKFSKPRYFSKSILLIIFFVILPTQLFAIIVSGPSGPIVLNSADTGLAVEGGGGNVNGGAGSSAVETNFNANNLNMTIFNGSNNAAGAIIQNTNAGLATIRSSGAGTGGTIAITNNNATILNNAAGPVFNFTATAVPVTIIDQSGGVISAAAGGNINLSSGAGGSVRLQLGTQAVGTSPAQITTPIQGDAASTVDVQNTYTTGTTITNVGTISANTAAPTNIFTIHDNITGWRTFTISATTRTDVNAGVSVSGVTNATFSNAGLFNLSGSLGAVGLQISNSGTFNQNAGLINLTGGRLTNLAGATLNLNAGQYIANTTNFGTINIQAAENVTSGTVFTNNGVFNIFRDTLTNGLGTPNIVSTVTNSVVNLFPPSGTFTTTNPWTNVPIVVLQPPATTFNIVNPLTGMRILTMSPGQTTNINAGGSISTSTLTLNNAGTLNINPGGSFTGGITGTAATTLNINTSLSTTGAYTNIGTINVNGFPGTIFTINNPVTGYNILQNSATIVMNGGTLSGGMRGNGVNSALIINRNFSTNGVLGQVLPLGTLTINPGATLTMNNPINAINMINNGNLALTTSQPLTGNYTQTGSFSTTILNKNPGNFGQLVVSGTANVSGTIIATPLDNGAQINTGDTFDVIVANTLVDGNPTVVTTPNSFITFSRLLGPGVPPNVIRLIASRATFFSLFSSEPPKAGLAAAIDTMNPNTVSPGLRETILTLRRAPSVAVLEQEMLQLLPDVSGALIMPTLYMNDLLLDKVAQQLDRVRLRRLAGYTAGDVLGNFGYSAGDMSDDHNAYGPFFFGNILRQDPVDIIDGYNAVTGGIGVLADFPVNSCGSRVGAALNYAQSGVRSLNTGNKNTICSVQGTLYGTFEYKWFYIDGTFSVALNHYITNRNVAFLGQQIHAKFNGIQKNGMIKAGFNIPIGFAQITPLFRAQYTLLNIDQYTESNGGPTLTVVGRQLKASNTAYGVKLMDISNPDAFLPEIHVLFISYSQNPNLAVTSEFTGGGPAFVAFGPSLAKTGTNVGGGITTRFFPNVILTGRFDYEYRKNLRSYSALLMVRYLFQ